MLDIMTNDLGDLSIDKNTGSVLTVDRAYLRTDLRFDLAANNTKQARLAEPAKHIAKHLTRNDDLTKDNRTEDTRTENKGVSLDKSITLEQILNSEDESALTEILATALANSKLISQSLKKALTDVVDGIKQNSTKDGNGQNKNKLENNQANGKDKEDFWSRIKSIYSSFLEQHFGNYNRFSQMESAYFSRPSTYKWQFEEQKYDAYQEVPKTEVKNDEYEAAEKVVQEVLYSEMQIQRTITVHPKEKEKFQVFAQFGFNQALLKFKRLVGNYNHTRAQELGNHPGLSGVY